MKQLAPGLYSDGDGALHIDAEPFLLSHGIEPTPENQAILESVAREMFTSEHGIPVVAHHDGPLK